MPLDRRLIEQQYAKLEGMERTKSYFSILATLILLIVLLLLIFPAIKHITTVNKEISDAKFVKKSLEKKLGALQTAEENYDALEGNLKVLDLALPIGSDFTPYLKKIEALAAAYNLKIVAIQFSDFSLSKPTQTKSLKTKKISYSISLTGSFPDYQKFLADLENHIRTSDVSSVAITREQDGSLTDTLNVTSYYLGIEPAPASGKAGTSTNPSASSKSEVGGGQ